MKGSVWIKSSLDNVQKLIGFLPKTAAGSVSDDVFEKPEEDHHELLFHVFLCHNSEDKHLVKEVGEKLISFGIRPWLDEWELRPGLPWQRVLEEKIENILAAAVFVGNSGIGPWQQMELEGFLREFVERDVPCPVIPVILPTCKKMPRLPPFLKGHYVCTFQF